MFQTKLANKNLYKAGINRMKLKLAKPQESDKKTQKIRAEKLKNGYKKVDKILHLQKLPFVLESI